MNRGERGSEVGKTNELSERRSVKIIGRRQELHGAIPESPPAFNLTIALCVVTAGCDARRACSGG